MPVCYPYQKQRKWRVGCSSVPPHVSLDQENIICSLSASQYRAVGVSFRYYVVQKILALFQLCRHFEWQGRLWSISTAKQFASSLRQRGLQVSLFTSDSVETLCILGSNVKLFLALVRKELTNCSPVLMLH